MKNKIIIGKILTWGLYLIAIHSFFVGIGLMFLPAQFMTFFGFDLVYTNFFRAQGGIFHVVMVIAYIMAAHTYEKTNLLIIFSVSAKFIATVFLLSYFIFIKQIWTVALSGIADCIMGIAVLIVYRMYKK
jgi:hypothetical protein